MSTIAMPTTSVQPTALPGRVLLRGISWQRYRDLRDELGDSPTHLTYDEGFLEIEVVSQRHEALTELAGSLVQAALDSVSADYQPLGKTTWDREEFLKAIEADQCFYVQNVAAVQGEKEIDLAVDPPPDLAIEVEVTTSALDKLRIYAALKVPEVWRIGDDATVRFLRLNAKGAYDPVSESSTVPRVTSALIEQHLKLLPPMGALIHSTIVRQFRSCLASAGTPKADT
jgi:Uma2 family endonuclease